MRHGLRIRAWSATSIGLVRKGNEDSYLRGGTVFAVADGMGGHQAGEVASATALEPISALDGTHFPTPQEATSALTEAIVAANTTVFEKAADDPGLRGMGTTLTALLVREGKFHLAHVGDSRAYLLRPGEQISRLTTDHTLVQQLIDEGRLSRDEADTHPQRSVITRAIGVEREVKVDTLPPLEMLPDDQVLLCSDGLTGPVSDDEIARILTRDEDGEAACQALIDAANDAGGPDNITVVLLRVEGELPTGEANPNGRSGDTQDLGPPFTLSAGIGGPESGSVTQIRTREDQDADFNAAKMGRYGGPQGVESRPPGALSGRLRRVLTRLFAALILSGVTAVGAYLLVSRAYFVGEHNGRVAIFRGLPQEVVGVALNRLVEDTDIRTGELPRFRQDRIRKGIPFSELIEARQYVNGPLRREAEEARAEREAPTPAQPPPRPLTPQPAPLDAPSAAAAEGDERLTASG